MKRGYLVSQVGEQWGVPVVAHSAREAKRMVWADDRWMFDDVWIDMSVRWRREADVQDLPYGLVENDVIALKRKLIDYLYY